MKSRGARGALQGPVAQVACAVGKLRVPHLPPQLLSCAHPPPARDVAMPAEHLYAGRCCSRLPRRAGQSARRDGRRAGAVGSRPWQARPVGHRERVSVPWWRVSVCCTVGCAAAPVVCGLVSRSETREATTLSVLWWHVSVCCTVVCAAVPVVCGLVSRSGYYLEPERLLLGASNACGCTGRRIFEVRNKSL